MSNIQFRRCGEASPSRCEHRESRGVAFLASPTPNSALLLICPQNIRNRVNSMKTNDKEISNLSSAPDHVIRAGGSLSVKLSTAGLRPSEPNRQIRILEAGLSDWKQRVAPGSNRQETRNRRGQLLLHSCAVSFASSTSSASFEVLPPTGAAATLSRQELNCCSCRFYMRSIQDPARSGKRDTFL